MDKKITKKDILILGKLEENARMSLKQIGKAVQLSPEGVAYRINRMERSGHILRYHTLIAYSKVGLFKYKLYLRLKAPSSQIVEGICQYFYNHKKTEWVAHCNGRWDIIVGFIVSTPVEFANEIENFFENHHEHVLEKAVTQTLYLVHLPRASITEYDRKPSIVYQTTMDAPSRIDALDRKILQAVANNARLPVWHLAKLVKSTQRRVAYRLHRLEKEGLILAYRVHLDHKRFGRTFYKLSLYLKSMNKKNLEDFVRFCGQLPNVVWPQQVLGSWDFEVDLDAPDDESVYNIISKIHENFPEAVLDHEQSSQIKEYKLDLFPGAIPPIKRTKEI